MRQEDKSVTATTEEHKTEKSEANRHISRLVVEQIKRLLPKR